MLRAAFPDHHYGTLDVPADAALAETDPATFLALHPLPLLIDEVQYAPALLRHLKVAIDASPSARGRILLTASQRFALMQGLTESLAGRIAIHELDTLSAKELNGDVHTRPQLVDAYACSVRGFFTALWNEPSLSAPAFQGSYVATYLERDVRQLRMIGDRRAFDHFVRLVAARSGQVFNRSDLARHASVTPRTVDAWLSVLEESDQITLLEPFHENISKRLVKSPKIFMNDVGLMCFLLGLRPDAFPQSSLAGSVFETLVFGELRKRIRAYDRRSRVAFFRDHDGHEVDLVIVSGDEVDLIECKSKVIPDGRDGDAPSRASAAGSPCNLDITSILARRART